MFLQNFGIFSKNSGILKIAISIPSNLVTVGAIPAKLCKNIGEKYPMLTKIQQVCLKNPEKSVNFCKRVKNSAILSLERCKSAPEVQKSESEVGKSLGKTPSGFESGTQMCKSGQIL